MLFQILNSLNKNSNAQDLRNSERMNFATKITVQKYFSNIRDYYKYLIGEIFYDTSIKSIYVAQLLYLTRFLFQELAKSNYKATRYIMFGSASSKPKVANRFRLYNMQFTHFLAKPI